MTKQELVNEMSRELDLPRREVERFLDALTNTVGTKISSGEKVAITGFGTFDLGTRAARRGRNPQTGEIISIPAMKMPRFRAGKKLKESVRA